MPVQEKILRVVEYGAFERVGGTASVEVDTRIIGATNADMPRLVHVGQFNADLLDRLSFDVLELPPLRERHGDVMLLAQYFGERMALGVAPWPSAGLRRGRHPPHGASRLARQCPLTQEYCRAGRVPVRRGHDHRDQFRPVLLGPTQRSHRSASRLASRTA